MSKFTRIGQIRKNKTKDGKEYKKLVLEKSFLDNAPAVLKECYTDKKGDKHLYLFDAKEGAPDFVVANICAKMEE